MPDVDSNEGAGHEHSSRLEELVFEFLERREDEGPAVLEELCEQHPELGSELRALVLALGGAGLLAGEGADEPIPEALGPYRLIRRLGSGGMGVVYVAMDPALGRRVALKVVRPDQLFFEGARERFRREVDAAGRLAHPGIAAVHSVGEQRGVPYFVMELVPGVSLAEVIEELAGRDPTQLRGADLFEAIASRMRARDGDEEGADLPTEPGPIFAGTWVETVLRIVLQVAEALEHAHRRAVVHRDVKPSNILVTPEGRALLVDFGLAARSGAERITRTGAIAGSACYMSPEILAGKLSEAGPRTDVYSLGVSCYELLTLRLPYGAPNSAELTAEILAGRPAPPRRWNPSVEGDAETVCLVAMDLEPERRYRGAEAFARDIAHVLERQPIEARALGSALRLKRWAQRNPSRALAAVLAFVVVVVGPLAFGVQQSLALGRLDSANEALGRALVNEEAERRRAEENLDRAIDAVDALVQVGETRLANVPMMESVRRELLELAARFFDELVPQRPDDEDLVAEGARAARSRGDVLRLLGETDGSEHAFRAQIETFRRLLAARPGDVFYRWQIAGCQNQLGRLLREVGDGAGARAEFLAARDALVELSELSEPDLAFPARPSRARVLEDLAVVLSNIALVRMDAGELESALEAAQESFEAAELLCAETSPRDCGRAMSAALSARGSMLYWLGRGPEAMDDHARELELLEGLVAADPDDAEHRARLVERAATYGGLLWNAADHVHAEEVLSLGYRTALRLVEQFPEGTVYQEQLVRIAVNLGGLLGTMRRLDEAREPLELAVEVAERLYARAPGLSLARELYGNALMSCGALAFALGDHPAAEEHHSRSIELLRAAIDANPSQIELRRHLCRALCNLAETRAAQGDYLDADAIVGEVVERCPDDPISLRGLAGVWSVCSDAMRAEHGDSVEADAYLDAALDALQRSVAHGYLDAAELRTAPALAPLRARVEFQELVRPLESSGG